MTHEVPAQPWTQDMTTALSAPMVPVPYQILSRRQENYDNFTVELAPVGGGPHPGFQPGQFNMLYAFGVGEVPISFSGPSHDPNKMVHTIRVVGATTRALSQLKRGDVVGLRGPFGVPWPMAQALHKDVVLVVGGVGLAPLRPVIYAVLHQRALFGRLVILYGARTPKELLFTRELSRWAGLRGVQVEVTVDRAAEGWTGHVGVVPALVQDAAFDPHHAIAMTCGPEVMMRFSARALLARGMKKEDIYFSMERNMKCAIGQCGRCQWGPHFMCKNGPVFSFNRIEELLAIKEL